MKTPKQYLILAAITFIIAAIIGADNYLLPVTSQADILDNKTYDREHGDIAYFLFTKTGNRYQVSKWVHSEVYIDGEIKINKSKLFGRPLRLAWKESDDWHETSIGIIRGHYFGNLVLLILLIYPLLLFAGILKTDTPNKRTTVYLSLVLAAGLVLFYLTY